MFRGFPSSERIREPGSSGTDTNSLLQPRAEPHETKSSQDFRRSAAAGPLAPPIGSSSVIVWLTNRKLSCLDTRLIQSARRLASKAQSDTPASGKTGGSQNACCKEYAPHSSWPAVIKVRVEVVDACRDEDVVPEVGEQIGRQRIGACGTGKEGPRSLLFDVADPIERGEQQYGRANAIEAPGGRGSDLGDAERGEKPSRDQGHDAE